MSKISIVDLEVYFRVGVPDDERAVAQRLLIDVELEHDFSRAASSDNITETIDYYRVSQSVMKLGEGRSWRLIEKLAADVAELVLKEFRPERVTVEVKKFILSQTRHVSVTVTRAR
ncbi:MAG TPA: dihydroneopterin aldolase [Verrucomicrobiota bacterium]|nr:dihydroneopterin aldolase [Verrucomicrobiota bacterium]